VLCHQCPYFDEHFKDIGDWFVHSVLHRIPYREHIWFRTVDSTLIVHNVHLGLFYCPSQSLLYLPRDTVRNSTGVIKSRVITLERTP